MEFLDAALESYCINHSSPESPLLKEITDFTYKNHPYARMITGPFEGSLLGLLVRLTSAKRVLEIGTFTGYSALTMAERLPANGEVVTLDIEPKTNEIAKGFWARSPHGKKIKPMLGEALVLLKDIKGPFDFIFIDADKENYLPYVQRALELVSPNGLIAVDNTLWSGRVLEKTQDPDTVGIQKMNDWVRNNASLEKTLVPIRDGILLIKKIS